MFQHTCTLFKVLLKQLRPGSLPSPELMRRMHPKKYPTDKCKVCRRETVDHTHILWNCTKHPEEARSRRSHRISRQPLKATSTTNSSGP
ncbi:hypothetical protein HPB50_007324 [Hyalomma asiaticum]|uniref:Uncharacterized protein n=1 Tax=Hyalomma asiaticum TaxID=266040 RepID=A0ACB7TFL6_HYAAI|nr:hypothetical protein HPB50_007324 [Hyalomma asiaticum]